MEAVLLAEAMAIEALGDGDIANILFGKLCSYRFYHIVETLSQVVHIRT